VNATKPSVRSVPKVRKPTCVGTGLVALDIVLTKDSKERLTWAGGSCGNVLTVLSFLGWDSYPLAHLKNDDAARRIVEDMRDWGVKTSLVQRNSRGRTPVIVERIENGRHGNPYHRFEMRCPTCGLALPRHKPAKSESVKSVIKKVPHCNVFYFDRVSRSAIELANHYKKKGAVIFFEPSAVKNVDLFKSCLKASDIVKYSFSKIRTLHPFDDGVNILMEVQTRGAKGLRYRTRMSSNGQSSWKSLKAYILDRFEDSAGAGDWCSAGILHALCQNGRNALIRRKSIDVPVALQFGQALAALNCCFVAARGSMYVLSKNRLMKYVEEIMDCAAPSEFSIENGKRHEALQAGRYCSNCADDVLIAGAQ